MPRRKIEAGPVLKSTELKEIREALHLDQRGFGDVLDVSQRYINLMEQGKRTMSPLVSDRARVAMRSLTVLNEQVSRLERKSRSWHESKRWGQKPPFGLLPPRGQACGCGHPGCSLTPNLDWQNAGHLWVFRATRCNRLVYLNPKGQRVRSPGHAGLPFVPPRTCSRCGLPRNLQKRFSRNLGCEIYSRNCYGRPGEHDPPTLFWRKNGRIEELPAEALELLNAGANPFQFQPLCQKSDCPHFGKRLKQPRSRRLKAERFLIYKCPGNHPQRFHLPGGEPAEQLRVGAGSRSVWTETDTAQRRGVETDAKLKGGYPIKKCPQHGCILRD